MTSLVTPIPIPSDSPGTLVEERRLWIGNLDIRITEFQLLKILQKYGTIEKFDLLFHKSGPLAGQPRGYGFVTFKSKEDAESMMKELDGKKIGSKHISVKWAHSLEKSDDTKKKIDTTVISVLSVKKEKKISPQVQIKAVEMKLKMMEHSGTEEFNINIPTTSSTSLRQSNCKRSQSTELKSRQIRHKPYLMRE
nr:probable RNA-binding protein 18 isoform X2 [Halyomorpha halys]